MILIVDDDPVFLGAAIAALAGESDRVLAASGSSRALELIKQIGPVISLVMIDLSLGSDSGFELIQAVKAVDGELPIIAFSGVSSRSTLESATAFGAATVLRKPIGPDWFEAIARVRR